MEQLKNNYLLPSQLNLEEIELPFVIEGNKSPTTNGMGFVFLTISPLGEDFLKNECIADKRVIDIGAGYSNIPIQAVLNGVEQYIANDLSLDHLKILAKRLKEAVDPTLIDKVNLLPGKAPDVLFDITEKYDAILADKVIHFFTPPKILEFIKWAKSALKPGGKIYVSTASPYSKSYKQEVPKQYLAREQTDQPFPGHFFNMMSNLDQEFLQKNLSHFLKQHLDYLKLPDEMVLFSRKNLVNLFEQSDMEVIHSYSFNMLDPQTAAWQICSDEESNIVGIIAQNRE